MVFLSQPWAVSLFNPNRTVLFHSLVISFIVRPFCGVQGVVLCKGFRVSCLRCLPTLVPVFFVGGLSGPLSSSDSMRLCFLHLEPPLVECSSNVKPVLTGGLDCLPGFFLRIWNGPLALTPELLLLPQWNCLSHLFEGFFLLVDNVVGFLLLFFPFVLSGPLPEKGIRIN